MIARIARKLRHLLVPHVSNNFRAKLLHNIGWISIIGIFLTFNLMIRLLTQLDVHVLGFTSSITIDEVVRLTNEKRIVDGLKPLRYNEVLADAARRKAANMLEENYWAHISPSGKSPWVWFGAAGYKYTHAGENLAKDFGSTDRLISAWMDSPTHRANIVSDKFQDIGVAVVPGTLQGKDTVLVVQLFGSTVETGQVTAPTKVVEVAQVQGIAAPNPPLAPAASPLIAPVMELKEFATTPSTRPNLLSEFGLKKYASLFTTALLLLVLLADVFIADSRQLSRRVGKNWAHIMFINVILILVTVVNAGNIL